MTTLLREWLWQNFTRAHVLAWLSAFVFTQVVECPLYLVAMRGSKRPVRSRLMIAFGASLITHPIVWFVIPDLSYTLIDPWAHPAAAYAAMVAFAESFAVGVEAIYLARLEVEDAWLWSLAANAASAGLGLGSRWLFGWP